MVLFSNTRHLEKKLHENIWPFTLFYILLQANSGNAGALARNLGGRGRPRSQGKAVK
jgi:hypothetical protein